MLNFDTRGNLKPYEPINSSIEEFKEYFVNGIPSKTREDNFNKYKRYSDDLKALLNGMPLKQWINGSFVSKKSNPKDIDLATFLNHSTINILGSKLADFKPDRSWIVYGVDAYIIEVYPEDSNLFKYTKSDIAEWLHLFSHTRRNRNGLNFMKGFIEINY